MSEKYTCTTCNKKIDISSEHFYELVHGTSDVQAFTCTRKCMKQWIKTNWGSIK